jgi:hypothetical protein
MTRLKTSIVGTLALVLLGAALAAAYWAAPYWTVRELKQAARDRDADALLAHVDQDALRKSVELALGFNLAERQAEQAQRNAKPVSREAQAQANSMMSNLPDLLASPTALMSMLLQGHPSRALDPYGVYVPMLPEAATGDWPVELRYVGHSIVEVRAKGATGSAFILRRNGLFDWKWSAIGAAS